jgi:hypothetical protein
MSVRGPENSICVEADAERMAVFQVMERSWLIMTLIGMALSEHPIIRSRRSLRRLTDRARKALFDLHAQIGEDATSIARDLRHTQEAGYKPRPTAGRGTTKRAASPGRS